MHPVKTEKLLYTGRFSLVELVNYPLDSTSGILLVRKKFDLKKWLNSTKAKIEEFEKSIKILYTNSHPNLCRILQAWMEPSTQMYNIFMKYYPKGSIAERLKETGKPIPVPALRFWMVKILSALLFLHERGMAHRNIRLSSLLISDGAPFEEVVLAGFGHNVICGYHDHDIMRVTLIADILYQAPEMNHISVWPYNARIVDMWQVGVCLFMMLNVDPPFPAELHHRNPIEFIQKQRKSEFLFRREFRTQENESLRQLVNFLLEPNPGQRITASQAMTHNSLLNDDC